MGSAHTLAVVQARMAASRLPGKILRDIAGEPMLRRVVKRLQRAKTVDQVVVATTQDAADDETEAFCQEHNYPCYRGSLHDVLDRTYQAARLYRAAVIVRITADCPLLDPQLVDECVGAFTAQGAYDFVANRLPPPWNRTYPIGLDTEVCAFAGLERAWKEAGEAHQREHVMPYFYEGIPVEALRPAPPPFQPGDRLEYIVTATSARGFRVGLFHHYPDYGSLRWTVDTAEDLELVRQVYACFGGRDDFSWLQVLELFARKPELRQINSAVAHKHYRETDERR